MMIETFPETTKTSPRRVQPEQRFATIGKQWELLLIAEAYDQLGAPNLIVSDGLAYLTDSLLGGSPYRIFVRIDNPEDDNSDVSIAVHLLDDLREGCASLSRAVRDSTSWEEEYLGLSHGRIHESAADLVRAACRRICESF